MRSTDGGAIRAEEAALATAVDEARTRLEGILASVDSNPVTLRRSAYLRFVDESRYETAALLEPAIPFDSGDQELTEAWIRLRIATGREREARELAWSSAREVSEHRATYVRLSYDA